MDTYEGILQFVKGCRKANAIVTESTKLLLRFSVELLILTAVLVIYTGIFSIPCMITGIVLVVFGISGCILNKIYMEKRTLMTAAYKSLTESVGDKEAISRYCDESMMVMKIGIVTAGINTITTGISVLLFILTVLTLHT